MAPIADSPTSSLSWVVVSELDEAKYAQFAATAVMHSPSVASTRKAIRSSYVGLAVLSFILMLVALDSYRSMNYTQTIVAVVIGILLTYIALLSLRHTRPKALVAPLIKSYQVGIQRFGKSPTTYILNPSGFRAQSTAADVSYPWRAVSSCIEAEGWLLLFLYNGVVHGIHSSFLVNAADARAAFDACKAWVAHANSPELNQLISYLATHAVRCPRCQYSLSTLTRAQCPECGVLLDHHTLPMVFGETGKSIVRSAAGAS